MYGALVTCIMFNYPKISNDLTAEHQPSSLHCIISEEEHKYAECRGKLLRLFSIQNHFSPQNYFYDFQ